MPETFLVGSIGDPTVPTAGAKLMALSETSYGQQVASTGGADSFLLIETDDVPLFTGLGISGEGGTVLLRRIRVKMSYIGTATVSVQPVVNFSHALAASSYTLPAVAQRTVTDLNVLLAVMASHARIIVQVLARTGAVGVMQISAAIKPLAVSADVVAGGV